MSLLSILLYGNLIFILLHKQISFFSTFNFYMLGSLSLNTIILLYLMSIRKLPIVFIVFILSSLLVLINNFYIVGISVFIRYIWFLTNIFLIYTILLNNRSKHFIEIQRYFIYISYIIILDIFISYLFYDNIVMPNQGLKTILLPGAFTKYLFFMAIPFLIISGRNYIIITLLIFISLLFGTRTGVISSLFGITMSLYLELNSNKRLDNIIKKTLIIFTLSVIFFGTFNILQRGITLRTVSFNNISSMTERLAIWYNYLSLLKNYPFGTGPQGGYKILENKGFSSEFKIGIINNSFDKEILTERFNILSKYDYSSEESLHFGFWVAYGFFGIAIWLHLIFNLIKNFRFALSYVNKEFSVIYFSFSSVLIYGLVNSFHLGSFYLVFLYISYFMFRSKKYKTEELLIHYDK